MPGRLLRAVGLALVLAASAANAHDVHEHVSQATATVVQLRYADDEPFALERYELYADGSDKPTLTGRTDAQGRIVFLPDAVPRWRVRAFSSDGHGVDVKVEVQAGAAALTQTQDPGLLASRGARVLLGVAALAAIFALLHLAVRRRRARPDAHP